MEVWRNSGRSTSIANISDRVGDWNHATTQVSTLADYCVCIYNQLRTIIILWVCPVAMALI